MESGWRIGCAGFSMKLADYMRRFDAVEVQETFFDPPAERTLARWRRQAPDGFAFCLRAWQLITHPPSSPSYGRIRRSLEAVDTNRCGGFLPSRETAWAWEVVRRAAEILEARAIVFQTPAAFTPTHANRENLLRFFSAVQERPFQLVWEPQGVWTEEEVAGLCAACGLVPAVDPLVAGPLGGGPFYFRIRDKSSGRGAFDAFDFERLCDLASGPTQGPGRDGTFIWDTRNALADADQFRRWCR